MNDMLRTYFSHGADRRPGLKDTQAATRGTSDGRDSSQLEMQVVDIRRPPAHLEQQSATQFCYAEYNIRVDGNTAIVERIDGTPQFTYRPVGETSPDAIARKCIQYIDEFILDVQDEAYSDWETRFAFDAQQPDEILSVYYLRYGVLEHRVLFRTPLTRREAILRARCELEALVERQT